MKFLGIVILGASVIAIGFLLSDYYKIRRRALESAQQLVLFLESEICFSGKDLGEIIKSAAEKECFSPLCFLKDQSFFKEMCQSVERDKKTALLKEDKKILTDLFLNLGKTDIDSQLKQCRLCANKLERAENSAKKEEEQKTRLVRTLSVCLSAALIILSV